MENLGARSANEAKLARLAVQSQLRYALCTPCERIFKNVASLKWHLEKSHKECSKEAKRRADDMIAETEKQLTREVSERRRVYDCAPLKEDKTTPCGALPALEGVEATRGFKCTSCEFYVASKRSMTIHLQQDHKENLLDASAKTDALWKQGSFKVQSIQGGSKTRFFPVGDVAHGNHGLNVVVPEKLVGKPDGPKVPLEGPSRAHQYDHEFFSDACEEGESFASFREQDEGEGRETHNDFIDTLNVPGILKLEGVEVEDAAKLTDQTDATPVQKDLSRLAPMYLERFAVCTSSAAPALLEALSPRDDKSFHAVGKNVAKRYSQPLANLLSFAFQAMEAKWMTTNACNLLAEYTSIFNSGENDEKKLDHVQKIMNELCLQHRSRASGVRQMFVRVYFACVCVSATNTSKGISYRFKEASEVSHCLAAMQYLILGTALLELSQIGNMFNRNSVPVDGLSDEQERNIRQKEEAILVKVSRNENNSLSFVRVVLNICWGMLKRETVDFKLVPCKEHDYCGFIRGIEVSLPFLGQCVRKWQQDCEEIMNKDLLCGGNYPPDMQEILARVSDNLQEKTNGYSFLDHPSFLEITGRWQSWLMREIAEQGRGVKHMFATPTEAAKLWSQKQLEDTIPLGKHRLYRAAVQKWLTACQKLQERLLLCLHLSSGSPARATEISTFPLQSSAYGQRNLYISQVEVVTLCRYSKMRKQNGRDTHILRVPDEKTGYLLKVYFMFFRRLESILVGRLHAE